MNAPLPPRMDRRAAIKWMMAGSAAMVVLDRESFGAERRSPAKGYGTDPDLIKGYKPGELWPLSFTDEQRRTAGILCGLIIPADEFSPSAASLNVQDFIDEWISAPYPRHEADRDVILLGLAWLDLESQKRFQKNFADLAEAQQRAICDDICSEKNAKSELKKGAAFFRRFRDLAGGGFYTTKEGMKDIGYVGNVPLASFDGPTPEALKHLGLV